MPKFVKPWYRECRKTWYVNLHGKQINLGPDRAEAFREYARLTSGRAKPKPKPKSDRSLAAVLDAFLQWIKPRRASDTFEWYRYRLERLALRYPQLVADKLNCEMVEDWVDEYELSVTSRRNYFRAAKKAFRWAKSRGLIARNRLRNLEVPAAESREIVISEQQYDEIRSLIRDESFRDLVVTTWETGCRPQESLRVEARHVDLGNQRWVFPRSESKNRKVSRVVYLSDAAVEITRRLASLRPVGKLFCNSQGKPWTTFAVNNMFRRIQIRIGQQLMSVRNVTVSDEAIREFIPALSRTRNVGGKLVAKSDRVLHTEARRKLTYRLCCQLAPKLSLYAIRHTWATNALQKGVDPLTTAILMGHSDPSTLSKTYQHVALNPVHMLTQAKKAAE